MSDKHRLLIGLDFDGTLISCREKQIDALQKSVLIAGLDYSQYDRFWGLKRNGATTVSALCETGFDETTAETLAKSWKEHVETWECIQRDRVFPGVVAALAVLSRRADLLLLSARRNVALFQRQVTALGLMPYLKYCETVFPDTDVPGEKAKYLVEYGAQCYVGDTENDAEAAFKAHIPVILVSTGQRSVEYLSAKVGRMPHVRMSDTFEHAIDEVV